MKSIITFFILFLGLSFHGLSHQNGITNTDNNSIGYQNAPAVSLDLFEINDQHSLPKMLKKGLVLEVHPPAIAAVLNENYLSLNLQVPNPDGGFLELELVQTNHLSKNFKVTGSISGEIPVELGKSYEGKIKGIDRSIVTASFSKSGVRLLLSTPSEGNMVIGQMNRLDKSSTAYIFYKEKDLTNAPKFACRTPDFDPAFEINSSIHTSSDRSMMCQKPIDVYVECDFLMYQDFAGNVQNITDYVIAIFHTSAALFRAEEVVIQTSEIFIWESEDPYTDNDPNDALTDFRDHLNGDFNGRIAHLLSTYRDETGFAGNGGLAYINTMCSPTFAVGYSNLQLDFSGQILPAESYDVVVITHEIGHNLGSKHTHACVWGPNEDEALDDCFETEGDCLPGPTPTNGGTIMSYCHVTPQGLNLSEGFGTEPGDKIRTQINNATQLCLSVGEANFQASVQPLSSTNLEEGGVVTLVGVPTSADYYYQWYKDGVELTGIIFPTINVSSEGDYSVSIVHNGCTEESEVISVTVGTFEASVSCSPNCSACVGQSIFLETNIAGATYQWSTGETTETIEVLDSGTYTVTVTDGASSSVATTSVDFTQQTRTDDPEICEGATYNVGISTYDQTGTYTNFVANNDGCVIEVTTNLTVIPAPQRMDQVVICGNETYEIGVSSYFTSGIYTDLIADENSCITEVTTDLTVLPVTEETNFVSICDGDSHIVEGDVYTQSGNYVNETINADGCNHTIYTNLTVFENIMTEVNASICEGGSYVVGASVYTEAGNYEDIFSGCNGCDSIILTNLVISDVYETSFYHEMCEGEKIEIDGNIYTETGSFVINLVASDGCDSLINVDIVVLPVIETFVERCADEGTEPGVYIVSLQGIHGCDSILQIQVHAVEPPEFLTEAICAGETYNFEGEILTETGNYINEQTDVNGCPVITYLNLTVADEIRTEETIPLCYGEEFQTVIYTADADLTFHGESINGCDSLSLIHLIVADDIQIEAEFADPSEGCEGNAGAVTLMVSGGSGNYVYLWSNGETTPENENLGFGLQSVTVTDSEGCTAVQSWTIESTDQLAVTYEATMVACRGDETGSIDMTIVAGTPPYNLFWSNGPVTQDLDELRAGTYTLFLNDANGCSLDTTITIIEPETALTIEQMATATTNNDETGTASVMVTGGVSPYTYAWTNGATTASIENLATGIYTVTVTDSNGCSQLEDVEIDQVLGSEDVANITDLSILPNPNDGLFSLRLSLAQSEDIVVEMYNVIGQRVHHSSYRGNQLNQVIDLKDQASGVYVLVLKTDTWRWAERVVITDHGTY